MIQKTLQNRTAIKFNEMVVFETGPIYISRDRSQDLPFSMHEVASKLLNGDFTSTVTVFLTGDNGQTGPNVRISRKGINRLLRIIRHTEYRIVQQNGQNFVIEGAN